MKIAIVCYPTHGGSGVVASELAMGLARKGHEIHIVSYALPFLLRSFRQNVFIHEVGIASYPLLKYPPYALGVAALLVDLVEQHDIQLIHAHYAVPHAASAYLAKQVVSSHSIKTITTLHGTDMTLVGADQSYYRVIKFAIEHSDGVTTVSDYLRKRTVEEFDIEREIRVIYNFIDPSRYMKDPDMSLKDSFASHGERILMHASNFRSVKRVGDVIRIFEKVHKAIPSRLILIGDGPERLFVQQLVRELKLKDDVFFLGAQDDTGTLLLCADLFLLPSEQESFGLAALEAMAAGVPVICSDTGGLPEVVEHGQTGYLSPIGNVQKMADYAIRVLTDRELYNRLKERARHRAFQDFNADRIIPQYESLYEEILKKA